MEWGCQDPELLSKILDSMNEGLMTVDKNFKIRVFNKSAEKITGYRAGDTVGKYCKYVFKTESCFSDCPLGITLRTKENVQDFEIEITSSGGMPRKILVNTAILRDEKNLPTGGIVTFRKKEDYKELLDKISSAGDFDGMIGRHPEMVKIFHLIEQISDSDAGILIMGESGTGKEMLADSIQKRSSRAGGPYLKVNCSVFTETLLASELFGHVKGAYTGAHRDRIGRFEMANGGTLFLDEIGEIPHMVQLQLLRILQDGSYERVGESITHYSDVRIIAATNVDLNKAVEMGHFRKDLFYRLNIIPVTVPPLRNRKTDIPELVYFFIRKYDLLAGKNIRSINPAALNALVECDWPGNIRQLENAIEYAFAISEDSVIQKNTLPIHIKKSSPEQNDDTLPAGANPEEEILLRTLRKNKWNQKKTALELGISRTTLWRKLKKINISV